MDQQLSIASGASVSEKDLSKVQRLDGLTVGGIGTYKLETTKQRGGAYWVRLLIDENSA